VQAAAMTPSVMTGEALVFFGIVLWARERAFMGNCSFRLNFFRAKPRRNSEFVKKTRDF
jgi:hypothetical protein